MATLKSVSGRAVPTVAAVCVTLTAVLSLTVYTQDISTKRTETQLSVTLSLKEKSPAPMDAKIGPRHHR